LGKISANLSSNDLNGLLDYQTKLMGNRFGIKGETIPIIPKAYTSKLSQSL
jgi:hypothetical protein